MGKSIYKMCSQFDFKPICKIENVPSKKYHAPQKVRLPQNLQFAALV